MRDAGGTAVIQFAAATLFLALLLGGIVLLTMFMEDE